MTTAINRVLSPTGFELRRVKSTISDLMSLPRLNTAGQIIEFVGVQGIGKSTLNNDVYDDLKKNWFTRSDLGQIGPATSSRGEIEQLHRKIYFRSIGLLKKHQPDPWKSITIARQMSKIISESLTIMNNDFPRGFVLDEGLFKNFPRELLELGTDDPSPLWANRAIIYLRTDDADVVVSRYQERADKRDSRGLPQRRKTDAEVRRRVEQDSSLFDEILETAQSFGLPTLVLRAAEDHQENIRKVLNFERSLRTDK